MNLEETRARIEELKAVYREGPGMVDAGSVGDHLLELFSICRDLIAEVERLEELREAMLKQAMQQEQEIEELEIANCAMREALREVAEDDDPRDGCAHADRAKQALASAPSACSHKEEAEKLREQLAVGEAGGRLLKAVQEKTQAEVAILREEKAAAIEETEQFKRLANDNAKSYDQSCAAFREQIAALQAALEEERGKAREKG